MSRLQGCWEWTEDGNREKARRQEDEGNACEDAAGPLRHRVGIQKDLARWPWKRSPRLSVTWSFLPTAIPLPCPIELSGFSAEEAASTENL